jgi:response regulator RpfG family c-di-GMP phosphodiesterase
MKNITILYVDDEINNLVSFTANFRKDYIIHVAHSGKEALEILDQHKIHDIITDQQMSEMSGIDFLSQAIQTHSDPARVLISAHLSINTIIKAVNQAHIDYYLTKPWNVADFKNIIQAAYALYLAKTKEKELIESLAQNNKRMRNLMLKK